jgi:predicted nucleic acid-binding protein
MVSCGLKAQSIFALTKLAALLAESPSATAQDVAIDTTALGLHPIPTKLADLQIAGVAHAYRLELATRNVSDFAGLGIALIDPWAA